jgi:hypothetical protein
MIATQENQVVHAGLAIWESRRTLIFITFTDASPKKEQNDEKPDSPFYC